MKKFFLFAFVGLLFANLVSCTTESKTSTYTSSYYHPDSVLVVEYPTPTDTLRSTQLPINSKASCEIACQDSFLFFLNHAQRDFIGIYNANVDTAIMFVGQRGTDVADFANVYQPYSLTAASADGKTYLFCSDYAKQRTLVIDVQASIEANDCVSSKVFEHDANVSYKFDMAGNYVYFTEKKTDIQNGHKSVVTPFYVINNQQETDTLNVFSKMTARYVPLSQSLLAVSALSPDFSKYVRAYTTQDLVDIVDLQQHTVMGLKARDTYDFEFFLSSPSSDLLETVNCTNAFVTLSSDKIFLLRYEVNAAKLEEQLALRSFQPKLYVLNYDGECLSTHFLDQCISRIAYSDSQNCIYALDIEGAVYRYDL